MLGAEGGSGSAVMIRGSCLSPSLLGLAHLQVLEEGLCPEKLCLKCPWRETEGQPTTWSLGRRACQVGTRGQPLPSLLSDPTCPAFILSLLPSLVLGLA
jgi:hypothetical protein